MQTSKICEYIYIYYVFLLLALMSWTDRDNAPNSIIRIGFVAAIMAPAFLKGTFWVPTALMCFFTTSQYNFAFPLMPTTLPLYVGLIFFVMFCIKGKLRNYSAAPQYIYFFTAYVFVVDMLTAYSIEPMCWCMVIILLLFKFIDRKDEEIPPKMALAFIVASLVLSISFIVNGARFAEDYSNETDLERSGWTDPNYFGMILGFGAVLAFKNLASEGKLAIIEKLISIASVVFAIIALVVNASRGAILSFFACSAFILWSSKIKKKYKIGICLAALTFITWLFQNKYFELLLYRVENDAGGGSGRTDIWAKKLEEFSTNGNVFNWLVGYGYQGGIELGFSGGLGFHNDYLAFMIEYGIVGIILFIVMLVSPILRATKQNRLVVVALISYMLLCFLTLEPMTLGLLPFWLFYLYICVIANQRYS